MSPKQTLSGVGFLVCVANVRTKGMSVVSTESSSQSFCATSEEQRNNCLQVFVCDLMGCAAKHTMQLNRTKAITRSWHEKGARRTLPAIARAFPRARKPHHPRANNSARQGTGIPCQARSPPYSPSSRPMCNAQQCHGLDNLYGIGWKWQSWTREDWQARNGHDLEKGLQVAHVAFAGRGTLVGGGGGRGGRGGGGLRGLGHGVPGYDADVVRGGIGFAVRSVVGFRVVGSKFLVSPRADGTPM
jgi:hypothetical protein